MTPSVQYGTLTLTCEKESLVKMEELIEKLSVKNPSILLQKNKILPAVREAVHNGFVHGNRNLPSRDVILTYVYSSRILSVIISDEGKGFDTDAIANKPDGGIARMKRYCDDLLFARNGKMVILNFHLENQYNANPFNN